MRRTTLLLVVIGALLVIGSGLALAAAGDQTGTAGPDTLSGDSLNNRIAGGGGPDTLKGRDGDDQLFGDFGGVERLFGGSGADFLNAADLQGGDILDPGQAAGDICAADPGDKVVSGGNPNTTVQVTVAAASTPGPNGTNPIGDCDRITVVRPNP
jgi:Ca2+-binding RTX toxin-like protein